MFNHTVLNVERVYVNREGLDIQQLIAGHAV